MQHYAFNFLFNKFKEYYLQNIFPDFNPKASLYEPDLSKKITQKVTKKLIYCKPNFKDMNIVIYNILYSYVGGCGIMVGVWDSYVGYCGVVVGVLDSYVGYCGVVVGVWNSCVGYCGVVVGVWGSYVGYCAAVVGVWDFLVGYCGVVVDIWDFCVGWCGVVVGVWDFHSVIELGETVIKYLQRHRFKSAYFVFRQRALKSKDMPT